MSAATLVAGYPVHAVRTFKRWTNPHGVRFTDWTGACGATGTIAGDDPFGLAGSARWRELCPKCFPSRHATYHPDPEEIRDECPQGHDWPAELDADACCERCGKPYAEFSEEPLR